MFLNLQRIFIDRKGIVFLIIVSFFLGGLVFYASETYILKNKSEKTEFKITVQEKNIKIVSFLNLFIDKVLKTNEEVSFEDRLKLENAIRDIQDKDILFIWEKFTQAETSDDVQKYCKELLEALVEKISY